MKMLCSNIQRFSLNDGEGIRTTIFTMGCPLRCPWCCNPENLEHEIKIGNNNITYGKYYELDELLNIIMKDKSYYENGGGITFSGGEFLIHIFEFKDLILKLKENNINIAIETSLYAPKENLELAIKLIDSFIIDFKILDKIKAQEVLKINSDIFKENIQIFFNSNKKYIARIPLSIEIVDKFNVDSIIKLFEIKKPEKVEVFKLHNLGKSKYDNLNMKNDYNYDNKIDVESIIKNMKDKGFNVKELSL